MGDILDFKLTKDEKDAIDIALEKELAREEFVQLLKLARAYLEEARKIQIEYDIVL